MSPDNLLKAYEDVAFLKRPENRAVRLQLEYLKPHLAMTKNHIESTVVIFGSARIEPPDKANERLEAAGKALSADPESRALRRRLRSAEVLADMSSYYEVAREFARLVSSTSQHDGRCDYVVMTGGGGGIMEAGNRGAYDANAKSVGLNISLPFEQEPNEYLPEELTFNFHYFSIRKMHFLLRARALCAFPGGFGTLDELFETLTLVQTRKIAPIPVILFGRAFWERLVNWDYLVEAGLICPEDLEIVTYCETAREAWEYIEAFWASHQVQEGATTTFAIPPLERSQEPPPLT